MELLTTDWQHILEPEFKQPYFKKIEQFLNEDSKIHAIYPPEVDRYSALDYTSYEETKVVILGQDPYHGPNQAHGLSFSVKPGQKIPPSLKNIYKELQMDIGCDPPTDGYLVPWAKQGVLLLNTVLSVRKGEPASHKGQGWERFTDAIIKVLNERELPVIFVLWGKQAQAKLSLITNKHHPIIQAPHPSPFSANRGFFGSKPFSQINHLLEQDKTEPIKWS
ncbi:uracil-DNA glycosylase [Alkalihalobacillus deserti]|uniref:uracil-DNA glycosylase n=1 Tax=Alkalihalobacillus deserti TaxID=2879466 RepID=UPI001D154B45|nr:uracil-DNA glycosylase [Alkalihalobacillus deserti]